MDNSFRRSWIRFSLPHLLFLSAKLHAVTLAVMTSPRTRSFCLVSSGIYGILYNLWVVAPKIYQHDKTRAREMYIASFSIWYISSPQIYSVSKSRIFAAESDNSAYDIYLVAGGIGKRNNNNNAVWRSLSLSTGDIRKSDGQAEV